MAGNTKLVRGALKINPHHKRNGLKSYVHALQKWNIGPSVEGPYCRVNQVHQQGSQAIFKQTGKRVGGRAHVRSHVLAKKDASSGETGNVLVRLVNGASLGGPSLTPDRRRISRTTQSIWRLSLSVHLDRNLLSTLTPVALVSGEVKSLDAIR